MMIHHADALEIIGDLGEFDYLITDPPYPVGGTSSMTSAQSMFQCEMMMENMAQSLLCEVVKKVRKKPDFLVWIFCDWRTFGAYRKAMVKSDLTSHHCVVWNKMIPRVGTIYQSMHEMVLFAQKKGSANRRFKSIGKKEIISPNVIEYRNLTKEHGDTHAFAKPPGIVPKLMGELPIGRVIDPFCGTGGLLVGGQSIGHEVVGIEMMEDACAIAAERLRHFAI